ncbi:MAG: tyrosine-type recombinase/integrase [Truepera sp.]|nr:tyrosine-type recombinase/integrase [Truepera sp.]
MLEHQQAQQESGTPNVHNLLFPTADWALMYPNNFPKRDFKAVLKRAGLPEDIRLYDLRHTCASLLLQVDVHPKVVSERLGHASITLTLDTYSHVLPSMQQEASDRLERLLYEERGDGAALAWN